jgi:hypothetical protein
VEILILAVLIGLIPGAIASSKGHSFVAWWFFGAALFIVALPCALMLGKDTQALEARALAGGQDRKCPHCAEIIKQEAKVCRFCGRDVPEASYQAGMSSAAEIAQASGTTET